MNIVNIGFEQALIITVNGEQIKLVAFKTLDPDNVKFGVEADRSVKVHREEIFKAIKLKASQMELANEE